ncbi:MAG TPA: NapC/NirT family cytochrome c [Anaerolineae bacterium]|nr:NapC/NirT family cytochrome c [Anaerolineae bacterium]
MRRIRQALHAFFRPPPGARLWRRLLPYATLVALFLVVSFSGAYAWEYTNSPQFCGTTCHTMPPEYTAYLTSPHARILCVECHIGRDFIGSRVLRKVGDIRHVVATTFQTYEFPIRANDMRPARETCERCHSPEKFADDSLREIKRFADDRDNTPTSIYLTLKTGGGSKRQGLGRGIHWHVESKVYYLSLDPTEQQIPYVRVIGDDGQITEYVDLESDIDPAKIDPASLKEMDCITCHNRITHLILPPEDSVDQLMARGLISTAIPDIHAKAVEVMSAPYDSVEQALAGIAGLKDYYQTEQADFYTAHPDQIDAAIAALQTAYKDSTFPEQKADWTTHSNNVGHRVTAGCFRCHDGKHLNEKQEAIRLECNLCHSIPVVAGPSDFVAQIEISRGPEPESHLNPNWLGLHRDAFDDAVCSNCHTTENPGGTDNTSFCSNSGCHGNTWQFAGLDAPSLREILQQQLPPPPTPAPAAGSALTYQDTIGPLFEQRCGACHGAGGIQDLDLTTYPGALAGGQSGPAIVPGDPAASLLIEKQSGEQPHFGQLTPEELQRVTDWIAAGAPEK